MARKKKAATEPSKLSMEDSRRLKGSAAELADFEAAKAKKAQEDALPSAEDLNFKKVGSTAPKKSKPKTTKKSATVVRNPQTGRAEKPTTVPMGTPVTRTADPVIKKFKNGKLVTIKPRRRKKQTPIPVPKPGQAGKLDGELVRVTHENAQQIYEQRRRTTLPDAGREEMEQPGRPKVEEAIMPRKLRGSQNGKNLGGFARSHKEVSAATHEALDHLQTMAHTAKGTPEHHAAMEAFNELHGKIGQIGNKILHKDLGLGRTIVQQHHGSDKLESALKIHRGIVLGRLEEGRIAEQSRADRSGKGKGKKNGS